MWAFLKKLLHRSEPEAKPFCKAALPKTIVVNTDMDKIVLNLDAAQERRRRLLMNPPARLPGDAIRTKNVRKGKNPSAVFRGNKYPVFYVVGTTGDDIIEAFINSNPRARVISFYINGPATDFEPSKDTHSPIYNIVTGELRIFKEDAYMATAIKQWLRSEHSRMAAEYGSRASAKDGLQQSKPGHNKTKNAKTSDLHDPAP